MCHTRVSGKSQPEQLLVKAVLLQISPQNLSLSGLDVDSEHLGFYIRMGSTCLELTICGWMYTVVLYGWEGWNGSLDSDSSTRKSTFDKT